MGSAFSETRCAAGLLQQFGGFPFLADHVHHLLFLWVDFWFPAIAPDFLIELDFLNLPHKVHNVFIDFYNNK